jgi:hypothetical protein
MKENKIIIITIIIIIIIINSLINKLIIRIKTEKMEKPNV